MEDKLAKIISVLFQPLLVPTYSLLILFNLNSYIAYMIPAEGKRMIMWVVFLSTFILPLVFIFLLYKRGMIKSLNMDDKEERLFPLIITGIFYFLAYYIIRQAQLDIVYQRMFMGSAVLIFISLIISLYWKISMHMMGVGGLVGALLGINQVVYADVVFYFMLAVFICGLVGFARLKLKAHTPLQVYAGFLAGLGIMLFFIVV